jgi:hypothetical protein
LTCTLGISGVLGYDKRLDRRRLAMGMKEQLQAIHKDQGAGRESLKQGAKALAEAIAAKLQVKPDEVAVLLLNATGQTLVFVWPLPLFDSRAAFPANHKTAIASVVLATLKGKVDNKLGESKHLKFYESVTGMDTSKIPIQKMVALPLFYGDKKLGVVEVSRKGKTPEEAGPNFTPADAQALVGLCKEAAPLLSLLIPDPFL